MCIAMAMASLACDQTEQKAGDKAVSGPAKSSKKSKNSSKKNSSSDDGEESGSGIDGDDPSGSSTPKDPGTVAKPGEALYLDFFNKNIRDPIFSKQCISCHVGPRVAADPRGPESIYVYDAMRKKLKEGAGPTTNSLIGKMVNVSRHSGGDVCPGGLTDAPCKAVLDWYEQEIGPIADRASLAKPQPSNNKLNSITETGRVNGWAVNPQNLTEPVKVRIYIGGDNASGKVPVETTANQDAFDGGADGPHAFGVDLPTTALDGKPQMAYVYMVLGNTEVAISGSPLQFTAYTQNLAQGKPHYDSTLATAMTNSCGGCHNPSYIGQWSALLSPPPSKGGTRTNNRLFLKASGVNHSGGNRCGAVNCDAISVWWDREFGAAQ